MNAAGAVRCGDASSGNGNNKKDGDPLGPPPFAARMIRRASEMMCTCYVRRVVLVPRPATIR